MSEEALPKPPRTEEPPFSYRPNKNDEATRKYLSDLLATKGSRQLVIDHCVKLAMGRPSSPDDTGAEQRLKNELAAARAEIKKLKDEPVKETTVFVPAGETLEQLNSVMKTKSFSNWGEAIKYCIKYTKQNIIW